MRSSALAIAVAFLLVGCGWFGPSEKYKTEGNRTTYRSAEESPGSGSDVTPAPQKIPGESKKN